MSSLAIRLALNWTDLGFLVVFVCFHCSSGWQNSLSLLVFFETGFLRVSLSALDSVFVKQAGLPRTHSDPPASASRSAGIKGVRQNVLNENTVVECLNLSTSTLCYGGKDKALETYTHPR